MASKIQRGTYGRGEGQRDKGRREQIAKVLSKSTGNQVSVTVDNRSNNKYLCIPSERGVTKEAFYINQRYGDIVDQIVSKLQQMNISPEFNIGAAKAAVGRLL